MKKHLIPSLAAIGLFFTAALQTNAAIFTWDGGSLINSNWNTGANWVGDVAPSATGQSVVFSGTTRLDPNNNIVTSLGSLTFAADAGAFTLSGGNFSVSEDVSNLSNSLQMIDSNLAMGVTKTVDTGTAGIRLNGGFTATHGVNKIGRGTLTLAGTSSVTGASNLNLRAGKILLDAESGGTLNVSNIFTFGANTDPGSVNQSGAFEVLGKTSGSTSVTLPGQAYFDKSTGANQIIVNSNSGAGTTLTMGSFAQREHHSTLNVDLSTAGSAFVVTGAVVNALNGILPWTTVTSGGTTGFARFAGTPSAAGAITQLDLGAVSALQATGNISTTNYKTSGALALTSVTTVNSLTITGSGSLTGADNFRSRAILMQEGAGDYTISTPGAGWFAGSQLYVHQYSTVGNLIISSNLAFGSGSTGYSLAKTGPGKLIYTGTSGNLWGVTDIQGGSLQLDGNLGATSTVYVREMATLSGSGVIGGSLGPGAVTVYTPVSVFAGGTLDASNTGDALAITGSLSLKSAATFKMDLESSTVALQVSNTSGTIVTLDGDLELTLNYVPVTIGDQISLIASTGGTISGTFATVNGVVPGSDFLLNYSGTDYIFGINYDPNEVYLEYLGVVPEPGTLSLLLAIGALAFGLFGRRRA